MKGILKNITMAGIALATVLSVTKVSIASSNSDIKHYSNNIPSGYYANVDSSSGQKLQSSLTKIISSGTKDIGYDGLLNAYKDTDCKPGTNIIWDMYSNCEFVCGGPKENHQYSKEGDGYNREHSVPQSWFGKKSPMKSDLFHVYPTDGYVNNRRGSYVFGEVASASYTSGNGSKVGTSAISGYKGTVFEPIDEYKGDFARTYFYMATRYASQVGTWKSGESQKVFKGSYPYLTDYAVDLFTKWSIEDPVSEKEINRNNAVYTYQKNRNPFIDHPEYINVVFENDNQAVVVDQAKVDNVISLITALPSTATLEAEASINSAKAAYDALNALEKVLVTNSSKLDTLITELKVLKGEPLAQYDVEFDAAGGAFNSTYNTSIKADENSEITLPTSADLSSTAYKYSVLAGWTASGKTYEPGAKVKVTSNMKFTAKYEAPASISVSQALEIATITGQTDTTIDFTAKGIVTEIIEDSAQYKNITFKIKDTVTDDVIEVFRAPRGVDIKAGDYVLVTGKIINYKGSKKEFNAGASYKLTDADPVVTEKLDATIQTSIGFIYNEDEIISLRLNYSISLEQVNSDSKYKIYINKFTDSSYPSIDLEIIDVTDIIKGNGSLVSYFEFETNDPTTIMVRIVEETEDTIKYSEGNKVDFMDEMNSLIDDNAINQTLLTLINKWKEDLSKVGTLFSE